MSEEMKKQYGQWEVTLGEEAYSIANPGPDGKKRFYEVVPGKYGEPIIVPEPDLAFHVPTGLVYVDVKGAIVHPAEKIAGVICKEGPRFSLSNPKAPKFELDPEGSLVIDNIRWQLRTLFQKDGKRFRNYDAYYSQEKPDAVRVLELGDLDLF